MFSVWPAGKSYGHGACTLNGSDATDLTKDPVISDSNCDAIFDEKYRLDEEFHDPECIDKN